jgi:hypothetical protein
MSKIPSRSLLGLGLILALFAGLSFAGEKTSKRAKKSQESVKINVTPWGPSQTDVDAARVRAEQSTAVQSLLNGTKYRFLEFNYIETEVKDAPSSPPTRFRAVFYDYTNDKTIVAESDFAGKEAIIVREEYYQPNPNDEEFKEATDILAKDEKLKAALESSALKVFRPMPDVTILDGTIERLINVGLDAQNGSGQNEIVSVSIKRGVVIHYPENAPPTSKASPNACGVANAGQTTTSSGTAGQYQLTITQGTTTLWEMLVIRPSASSGSSKRSGVEVRDVKYKGKSVLKRGHVPILNVQYTGGQCGPYRDWQYQEGMFATPASGNTDPAAGIRIVAPGQTATTALENGTDTGNFRGVAVYTQNNETVLVSELEAGWYRYVMEWRFADDGTIRPRFGFGATDNSCVCFSHNHHAYWRLDFDVVNSTNKVFQVERGRKFLKPIATEMFTNKNVQTNRSLLIQNSTGNEAYELVPNPSDGIVDTFGVHDMWVMQYKSSGGNPTELEDGITCVTCSTAFIQIDPFLNSESVVNQDVVVWYGAHFLHNDSANVTLNPDRSGFILAGPHVIGPDIRPVRW